MGVCLTTTPVIFCDNLSLDFHSKMKHLAIVFYFIREQVQNGTLRVTHVSTDDQLADFLTKPLSRPRATAGCSTSQDRTFGLPVRLTGAYRK